MSILSARGRGGLRAGFRGDGGTTCRGGGAVKMPGAPQEPGGKDL
jgi:hypothetical protein